MNLGIVIQARTGSTRLPQKMLLPFFEDKTILDILLQRIKSAQVSIPIVLATTGNEQDSALIKIAERNAVGWFRGNEHDVLQRFVAAAAEHEFDSVIRICADNPFLSMSGLRRLIDFSTQSGADYASFQTGDGTPSIKTHFGFWAEYVTLDALKRIQRLTDAPLYHEHVTNYAYSHPKTFSLSFLPIEKYIEESNVRLTVDTQDDFTVAAKIYAEAVRQNLPIEPENIIPLVSAEMKSAMRQQMLANSK